MCACLAAAPMLVFGQQAYGPQGSEYRILGSLPLAGDQSQSDLALSGPRGYLIWQDNVTDSDGHGISAQRIDQTLSGVFSPFKVNQVESGEQEQPKVAMLQDGGAIFVWKSKGTNIAARIASSRGLLSAEFNVNSNTRSPKNNPALAVLQDGSVMVVWGSEGQDGSMQGVYGQRLAASGNRIGGEVRLNSTTSLNQRSPAIVPLNDGGFVAAWVHESGTVSIGYNVDIYARRFDSQGNAAETEFRVNSDAALCANPTAARATDGSFVIAWSQRPKPNTSVRRRITTTEPVMNLARLSGWDLNSWDIFGRSFNSVAAAKTTEAKRINSNAAGKQYEPRLATLGSSLIAVWTNLGMDGDQEGVYGRFLNTDFEFFGDDFRVNTRTVSKQIHPAVAGTGDNRFLVVWSGFLGGSGSFELFAQRYEQTALPLEAPSSPFVSALTATRLSVTWQPLAGLNVEKYLLYLDDSQTPIEVSGHSHTITHLSPLSTHKVVLRYKLTDGRLSPPSAPATATTWDEDNNGDGLPDDWQAQYWPGIQPPAGNADSDGDGASNSQEFLAGTDPTDAQSVLRVRLSRTPDGVRLEWNAVIGSVYQAQRATNLRDWADIGSAHFAYNPSVSLLVGAHPTSNTYYRVIRIR